MDLIKFFHTISPSKCSVDEIKEIFGDSKIDLNTNYIYSMGITWILPLPLIVALQYRNYEVAYFLMEKGAKLDAYCKKTKKTPREYVTEDFIKFCKEKGKEI